MATDALVMEYWWWGLQMFLVPFTKWSSWLTNVFLPTVNSSTGVAVDYTVLIGNLTFIFWWHQDVFECPASLEMYVHSMSFTDLLDAFAHTFYIWNNNVTLGWMCPSRGFLLLLVLVLVENLLYGPPWVFTGSLKGERYKEHLKAPSPIFHHQSISGHEVSMDNFKILGREDNTVARTIKESIYIRVNNPILNRNIGKYNLPHIWDNILFNLPELKKK